MVLSVYRDYGVIPKDSRNDNFNRTPENLSNYQLVQPGDLVVNRMKAWQGSLGISKHQGIVSPDYEVLRPTIPQYDRRFLHSLLRSRALIDQYALRSTGIRPSQWRLYWDEMKTIEISLPGVEQQRVIADYLDLQTVRIDTFIEEQQRLIEMLLERRRALVARVVCFGVDEDVELRDSGDPMVGLVPRHWTVKAVRHWTESLDGQRIPLSGEERADRRGDFDYYGASGVIDQVDGYLFDEPLVLVSEDGANLLMRSTPIAFAAKGRYWVNNHAHVLRPLGDGDVDFWAQRLEALDVTTVVSGSAQPKLTAGALMGLRVSAPDNGDEQRRIATYLAEQTSKIDVLIAEAERFIELSKERRGALITAAVTGQIDVRMVA
ncbi:restriction endonuclease subunit S [Rhodococcus sp. C3V]|uniref:restriction endonuclease subunit S n=1 Tax=unclassified Rhodococcus (in: high G+C Gram-positive bacteria) TaxID=192944 RepID=UPI00178B3DA2|nr:restriction endonuclease subunit S [Rhodococcus sp. C3V]MDF3318723.1 restriction endonuclease subunit S [Rhodococcus sp. C3V]